VFELRRRWTFPYLGLPSNSRVWQLSAWSHGKLNGDTGVFEIIERATID
jgi:hypothetical protein